MARRRRQAHELERVLGANALFATAYGNVGSSIYYALGVTAFFALGLTPLVFVIAGLFFAATAATYAEGTVRYPEAGGSSSFARHAFNELVSFGAAWAQMLNYVITIAISAFFVPHYLSIFWAPLRDEPVGHHRRRDRDRRPRRPEHRRHPGVGEDQRRARGDRLRDAGAPRRCSASSSSSARTRSHANIHFGAAPTWSHFLLAIPVGMIAYTGIETVSNLSEEARDPVRSDSALDLVGRDRRLRDLLHAAVDRALGDAGASRRRALPDGARRRPAAGRLRERPGARPRRAPRHPRARCSRCSKVYVGLLAATILFIATNAGVIGASRITYSMAGYRQLPAIFRRLHPKFKTPWLSLIVFAGIVSILVLLPGRRLPRHDVLVRRDALVHGRARRRDPAPPQARRRGARVPRAPELQVARRRLAALRDRRRRSARRSRWLDVVVQYPSTRYAGLGWLAVRLRRLRRLPAPRAARAADARRCARRS